MSHYEIDSNGDEYEVEDYDEDEYYDEDEWDDPDGYWDWWGSFNDGDEDTDISDGGDEREVGSPPSDMSDIPF